VLMRPSRADTRSEKKIQRMHTCSIDQMEIK
jgi:hypothetical protein